MRDIILKRIFRYILSLFGMVYKALRNKEDEILILMYHRINDDHQTELDVGINDFKWQMDYLNKCKYNVISMNEALENIISGNISGKSIVITFDDGYEDFYRNAYPILRERGFPSTVYIVPGYIDTGRMFYWDAHIGESNLMSWEEIQQLNNEGLVDFGSHTYSHNDINKLDINELRRELCLSKVIIEERLKRQIIHFAYPQGRYSKRVEKMVGQYYGTGVLIYKGKKITASTSAKFRTILKRMPVQGSDDRYLFIARIRGWLILEDMIRKVIGEY